MMSTRMTPGALLGKAAGGLSCEQAIVRVQARVRSGSRNRRDAGCKETRTRTILAANSWRKRGWGELKWRESEKGDLWFEIAFLQ